MASEFEMGATRPALSGRDMVVPSKCQHTCMWLNALHTDQCVLISPRWDAGVPHTPASTAQQLPVNSANNSASVSCCSTDIPLHLQTYCLL